jgi:tRNA threonylcarbamoyladenosine modification (KEOPS) complex  Pcc1 subunit
MFFSHDVVRANGRIINQIIRVDMTMQDNKVSVSVRAFVPAGVDNATVVVGGFRGVSAGTMRGTINMVTGDIDGIVMDVISDDVARVIADGIIFMKHCQQRAKDAAKKEAK